MVGASLVLGADAATVRAGWLLGTCECLGGTELQFKRDTLAIVLDVTDAPLSDQRSGA